MFDVLTMMHIDIYPYELLFKHPFRIAHTLREGTTVNYIRISDGHSSGWGEIVLPPYVTESRKSSIALIQKLDFSTIKANQNHEAWFNDLEKHVQTNPATVAGIEMAIYNLIQSKTGKSIYHQLEIEEAIKPTSYTIGIASNDDIKKRIHEYADVAYFKLKVDEQNFERIIAAYLHSTNKPFVVDANQGFSHRLAALTATEQLHRLGVGYLEQPFHKDDIESHTWLKQHSKIPIIADESFQNIEDIDKIKNAFDGVNIKLMKCGGLTNGVRISSKIKAIGLKIVLGCMSGSSLAINAAKHLTSLVDWLDLDGPLLIKNDLFSNFSPDKEKNIIARLNEFKTV